MFYADYISYSSQILTVSILSFFIVMIGNEYRKRRPSYLKSSYYVYIFAASIAEVTRILFNASIALLDHPFFIKDAITSLYIWYHAHGMGSFHLLLSLNRCTALLWPMKFNQIWSHRNTLLYGILVCLYPIASDAMAFINPCFWNQKTSQICVSFQVADSLQASISTIGFSAASLIFTFGSLAINKWFIKSDVISKINKSLVIQSIYASILLLSMGLTASWASFCLRRESFEEYAFWMAISQVSHNWYHILIMISPIFASAVFKKTIVSFYSCSARRKRSAVANCLA